MRKAVAWGLPTATLFAQILALTVLSLALAQMVNIWIIFHLPRPTPDYYTATEIARALQSGPGEGIDRDHPLIVRRAPDLRLDDGMIPAPGLRRLRTEVGQMLGANPDDIIIAVDADPYTRGSISRARDALASRGESRDAPFVLAPFTVALQQADGSWRVARSPQQPLFSPWQARTSIWLLITSLGLAPVAWFVARRLASSVALFAAAAERLGRDPNAEPLKIKGPREIIPAIVAFNEMQERLRRYVADRTAMAGAMAHDLRTPLTRMRFRIEAAPPELRVKMAKDIDEMEAMVAATLAYVRDAHGQTEHTRLELSSLIESVVDDLAETGAQVSIEYADRVVVQGDPMSLRRMLANLFENSSKFAGGARARLRSEPGWAVIEIEDDGPGIPEAELEKVFEPFYRGEPSRSRETGGSGLGLAAVRSIARLHGGEVTLRNQPKGGLVAQVRLPA